MTQLHYIPIPLATIEDETEIVRLCLRRFGRQLQRQGEIPPEVSEAEINAELEPHIPGLLRALHNNPHYPQMQGDRRHIEGFLQGIIEAHLQ